MYGEGLIRQDKSRKRSKSVSDIKKMASVQKRLLIAGLNALKPGGKLLYCTCSIAPEENEFVVEDILNLSSRYYISKILGQYGVNGLSEVFGKVLNDDIKFSQRLYPHLHDTIGFYLCLFKKTK